MNDQYFGDRRNPSENDKGIDQRTYTPVVNSDPFADRVPVDANLINPVPMGGTVAAVAPLNAPFANEIPLFETPAQEIPMGGTVAAVGPMSEPLAGGTQWYGSPVQETTMVETVAVIEPVDETMVPEAPVSEPVIYMAPTHETITHAAPVSANVVSSTALLDREESDHFRTRWNEIQGKFVDEPRTAVQQADALVSEVVENITQMFAKNHSSLESQWNQGNDVSTEDLRKALQQYRSFFNRLVV